MHCPKELCFIPEELNTWNIQQTCENRHWNGIQNISWRTWKE